MAKCNKIRHIVRIKQMLRSWRKKAAHGRLPPDVPSGHVAISVGKSCSRFIVPASYLNHPVFGQLLTQAEEEYGFDSSPGPVVIPCDESLFEEILKCLSDNGHDPVKSDLHRCYHVGIIKNNNHHFFSESRPLLYGFSS